MISKSLFFKLQMEDFKRRIWTIALSVLMFFLFLPIQLSMRIEDYERFYNRSGITVFDQIVRFMGPMNDMIVVLTIGCAVICGLSGFYYLQSRKKVDLYHSLPIRREFLFSYHFLNGILIYFIPYIINVILCFIVLQTKGYMNADVFITTVAAMGVHLLFYCLLYTLAVIAVILTGNIIISGLGVAVFLLYGILISEVKEMYFYTFFSTYYGNGSLNLIERFFSPISIYINTISQMGDNGLQGSVGRIIVVSIVCILLIGLAILLYRWRSSEAAGKAMAYSAIQPVVKFLLVILLSLAGGIIFYELSSNRSYGWFLFGLIFVFILSHAIIEIIYHFDIRSAFRNKKQMALCAIIVAVIASVFRYDVFQYDTYFPQENKLASMSVALQGLDNNLSYFRIKDNNAAYIDQTEYQLQHMKNK